MKKSFIITGTILSSLFATSQAFAATNYQVKEGDTLNKISQQQHTSVDSLKSLNNLNSNLILPGQTLKVDNTENKTYTVQSGDSLSQIAKKFNTTIADLVKLNPEISNPNLIVVGQTIHLSGEITTDVYTVQLGDTISGIAKSHNTTVDFLLSLNPEITNADKIRIGQSVKVSGTVVNVSKPVASAPSESNVNTQTQTQAQTNTSSTTDSTNDSNVVTPTPSTPAVSKPAPAPASAPAPSANVSSSADNVIAAGQKYLGAAYQYGASTSRTDAFDCSSFTLRAFKEGAGVTLPRSSSAQSTAGTPVSLNALQKGDLVFFDTDFDGSINHVGIYVGNGQMINSATSGGVSYATITSGYWKDRLVKAIRVLN